MQEAEEDVDIQENEPETTAHNPRIETEGHLPHVSHLAREAEGSLAIKGNNEELIRKALEKHGGNRKKAAAELGISERTLYRKLPPEYRKESK